MAARTSERTTGGWQPLTTPPEFDGSFRLPTSPFGRFAVAHAVSAAGDTLITIGLAQTLFFVSPDQARGRILLYLLLTLAPFAVVSPFIGPLVDRMAAQRKWVVVFGAAIRAVLCLLMARDTNSLLLFPEAFATLVLSKGYAVTRSSLVPDVVAEQSQLVRANSRLTILSGLAGFVIAVPGGALSHFGASWVLGLGGLVFFAAALAAGRIELVDRPGRETSAESSTEAIEEPDELGDSAGDERLRATAFRLAGIAMSVQRGLVGFVTFLVAFTFRDEGAPNWWLGLVGAAGIGGGLLGAALAPRLRHVADEGRILLGSLVSVTVCCLLGILWSGRLGTMFVAAAIGIGASVSRLAFDAIVQSDNTGTVGARFARFETRFQLAWVLGALVPVIIPLSRPVGCALMGLAGVAATAIHAGGEAALARIDSTVRAGASVWRRPDRPSAVDWERSDDWSDDPA
jgi:MFS-type transporter involved in bile tolerance (Atg22 family)